LTDTKLFIPDDAQEIIEKLEKAGHSAYIVGGCVRDAVLGNAPHDYDLCTSATPEQMKDILKDHTTYDTGLKHGTITVAGDSDMYEVTTYRIDGEYEDNRHPTSVQFVDKVELDLSRRDFTMNAMAYNHESGLVDPYGGLVDIKNKLIRCVGNANDRFQEDALRILRAIRFASRFGFDIEAETEKAIHKNKHLLVNVSEERKTSEFCKILTNADANLLMKYRDVFAEFIPEIKPMFDFNQRTRWHKYDVYAHTVHAVEHAPKDDLVVRLTMFFHDIGKPETFTIDDKGNGHFYGHPLISEEITEKVMRRMKFDNATLKSVLQLVENHDNRVSVSEKGARKLLRDFGEEQAKRLLIVQECDKSAQADIADVQKGFDEINEIRQHLDEAIKTNACCTLKDLAINGNDLMGLGMKGVIIGKTLNKLLDIVIKSPSRNEKETLLKMAPGIAKDIESKLEL
jgi:tRNA nucleotidyltransferase (CCA-adding enzyme)